MVFERAVLEMPAVSVLLGKELFANKPGLPSTCVLSGCSRCLKPKWESELPDRPVPGWELGPVGGTCVLHIRWSSEFVKKPLILVLDTVSHLHYGGFQPLPGGKVEVGS